MEPISAVLLKAVNTATAHGTIPTGTLVTIYARAYSVFGGSAYWARTSEGREFVVHPNDWCKLKEGKV